MCECKKLLVVALELNDMVGKAKRKQTDKTIQEIMLGQSLYGVQLSLDNMLKQIHQAIGIEKVNGDS